MSDSNFGEIIQPLHCRASASRDKKNIALTFLIRRPRLLVLDEPTFGQDRLGYEGLLETLRARVEEGVCLVVATHDERLVSDLSSRVVRLDAGRIVDDQRMECAT